MNTNEYIANQMYEYNKKYLDIVKTFKFHNKKLITKIEEKNDKFDEDILKTISKLLKITSHLPLLLTILLKITTIEKFIASLKKNYKEMINSLLERNFERYCEIINELFSDFENFSKFKDDFNKTKLEASEWEGIIRKFNEKDEEFKKKILDSIGSIYVSIDRLIEQLNYYIQEYVINDAHITNLIDELYKLILQFNFIQQYITIDISKDNHIIRYPSQQKTKYTIISTYDDEVNVSKMNFEEKTVFDILIVHIQSIIKDIDTLNKI